ncbi:MAG: PD-(D/E)XK nuclease-like domain-containing protein [Microbacterium sp.]|uniref:PD-(D/E)XK nuclease-like domain-containing protein n=1 Tax=Microbacterium sp. TaxID=51671 RepID=UPI0025D0DA51|nr:PD-(D/E)XK nuclease-like domain-containing protein [Microbacterium sp.]MBQ9916898.1 PD-(D/E)XK nuclease-like domain-containing protein [Microbacterium sp.]
MTEYRGLVLGLDEVAYHAHPALSSTGARQLLKAPAKFFYERSHPSPPRKSFDVGTLSHSKILGVGAGLAVYPDGTGDVVFEDPETGEVHDNVLASNGVASTKLAKSFEAWARAAGMVPLKRAEAAVVDAMAESVLARKTSRALLEQEGVAEASVFATDPETGIDEKCRFDFLGTGSRPVAVDVKTDRDDVDPVTFSRTVAKHGYHIQQEHYLHTAAAAGVPVADFTFITVEKEPPYLVAEHWLDPDFREIGARKAAEARARFAAGIESGVWPGYPDQVQIVRPPQFLIYDHIDATEAEAA